MEKYFNFNNEEYILPIDLAEDGTVTMQANGQEIRFATVQELAENYAIARNVATENLKNWTLVEDGDTFSFVLCAATAGADFFQDDEDEYPVIYAVRLNDDDYDEYIDEDDEVGYYDLTSDEQRTLEFMYPGLDEGDLTELLQRDEYLIEHVQNLAANFAAAGNGNFELGIGLAELVRDLNDGELPDNLTDEANRQLQITAIAHRNEFPVIELNVTTRIGEDVRRPVNEPFRPTELVTKVAGKYIVVTR